MMIPLLCAFAFQTQGDLSKYLPPPTGNNGYEEYVHAAEMAKSGGASLYRSWLGHLSNRDLEWEGDLPDRIESTDCELDVRRKCYDKFKSCLEWIEQGNQKPVYDPRTSFTPATLFPEYSYFKQLEFLETNAAHLSFADGLSGNGVNRLEQGFSFAEKLGSQSILIGRLVGISCEGMVFAELDDHWPQYSLDDARELKRYFGQKLGSPQAMLKALTAERSLGASTLNGIIETDSGSANNDADAGDGEDAVGELKKLSPTERRNTVNDAIAKINGYYDKLLSAVQGPEREWLTMTDFPGAGPNASLKDRLADMIVPSLSGVVQAELRTRIRYRLAYLNALAVEFRWLNGRLPKKLDEFVPPSDRVDPSSGQPYRYRLEGRWFTLTREGKDALGSQGVRTPARSADPGAPGTP